MAQLDGKKNFEYMYNHFVTIPALDRLISSHNFAYQTARR